MSFLVRVVLFGSIVGAAHPTSTEDPADPAGGPGTAEAHLVRPLRPQSGGGDDVTATRVARGLDLSGLAALART